MSKLARDDTDQAELIGICLNERNQFYGFGQDVTGLFWKFFAPTNLNDLDLEYEEGGSFTPFCAKNITPEMIETLERACEEKPGVFSEDKCWVSFHDGYLYIAGTSRGLARQIINEFQHDKHLVM